MTEFFRVGTLKKITWDLLKTKMLNLLTRGVARHLTSLRSRNLLKRQLQRAIKAAGHDHDQVCLSLSDDVELLELNRTYANEDHATDVLSFSQEDFSLQGRMDRAFLPLMLGDIIISVETAKRQAEAAAHSLEQELLHLAVHGFCHLLGYDHTTKEEEWVMFGYEAKLREQALTKGRVQLVLKPPKLVRS